MITWPSIPIKVRFTVKMFYLMFESKVWLIFYLSFPVWVG